MAAFHQRRQRQRNLCPVFFRCSAPWVALLISGKLCFGFRCTGQLRFSDRLGISLQQRRHCYLSALGSESSDECLSQDFPFVRVSRSLPSTWIIEASEKLRTRGVCGLLSDDDDGETPPIPTTICTDAAAAAASRLTSMHSRIRNRGVDPSGAEAPYRFTEVVCRDECGGRRFDVPVPWAFSADSVERFSSGYAPLNPKESDAFGQLHFHMDQVARPVMDSLWSCEMEGDDLREERAASQVTTSGFLINEPGSQAQDWHRDGPEEGYINAFVALVDLVPSLGPTALIPDTHTKRDIPESLNTIQPLLKKGEILLFDYRTLHRGQGNTNSSTRSLGYAVFSRNHGASSSGDLHNFPAAVTLEYD